MRALLFALALLGCAGESLDAVEGGGGSVPVDNDAGAPIYGPSDGHKSSLECAGGDVMRGECNAYWFDRGDPPPDAPGPEHEQGQPQ